MPTSNPAKDFMEKMYPHTYEYLNSQSENFMVTGELVSLLNIWLADHNIDWIINPMDSMIRSLDRFEEIIEKENSKDD